MRRILLTVSLLTALTLQPAFAGDDVERFGEAVTETQAVPIAKLAKKPKAYSGQTVRIEGTVKDVCQGQGCWIEVADAKGKTFLAKSLDESVLVPKAIKGRRVVVQGVMTSRAAKGHAHEHTEAGHSCPAPSWVLDMKGVEMTVAN